MLADWDKNWTGILVGGPLLIAVNGHWEALFMLPFRLIAAVLAQM